MRDISTKVDGVDSYPADVFNSMRSEIENAVTSADITLDAEAGPDTNLNMLGSALALYAGASNHYQDGGAADAYVLSHSTNLKPILAYKDGVAVSFKTSNVNTGASTINVSSRGVVALVSEKNEALVGGEVSTVFLNTAVYNSSNSNFELIRRGDLTQTKITVDGTYDKADYPGLKAIIVELVGGGGGAGGVDGQTASDWSATGGAAAGGYSKKLILASDLATSETVTIGDGGAGGAAGNNVGILGGDTSFGAHLQATGGLPTTGDVASSSPEVRGSNTGGIGSGGDINADGGVGGLTVTLSVTQGGSGRGGDSFFGGGGKPLTASGHGSDAVSPGSGGGGAYVEGVSTNYKGGDGADGIITVTELY